MIIDLSENLCSVQGQSFDFVLLQRVEGDTEKP